MPLIGKAGCYAGFFYVYGMWNVVYLSVNVECDSTLCVEFFYSADRMISFLSVGYLLIINVLCVVEKHGT